MVCDRRKEVCLFDKRLGHVLRSNLVAVNQGIVSARLIAKVPGSKL